MEYTHRYGFFQSQAEIPRKVADNIHIIPLHRNGNLYHTPEELMGWTKYEQQLSEEVKLIEQIQAKYGKAAVEILSVFVQLNDVGQAKAIDTIQDLTDVPKYRKDNEQ